MYPFYIYHKVHSVAMKSGDNLAAYGLSNMLEDPFYDENSAVQRVRAGEKPSDIGKGVLSRKQYGLKLPWNSMARNGCNAKIYDLAELAPSSYHLNVEPIYSMSNPETCMAAATLGGLLAGAGIRYYIPEAPEFLPYLTASIGAVWSSLIAAGRVMEKRRARKRADSQLQEMDRLIGIAMRSG